MVAHLPNARLIGAAVTPCNTILASTVVATAVWINSACITFKSSNTKRANRSDAPSGTRRSAVVSDTFRLLVTSSRVTGMAVAILVVEKAIDNAPNIPLKNLTGPIFARNKIHQTSLMSASPISSTPAIIRSLRSNGNVPAAAANKAVKTISGKIAPSAAVANGLEGTKLTINSMILCSFGTDKSSMAKDNTPLPPHTIHRNLASS